MDKSPPEIVVMARLTFSERTIDEVKLLSQQSHLSIDCIEETLCIQSLIDRNPSSQHRTNEKCGLPLKIVEVGENVEGANAAGDEIMQSGGSCSLHLP